MLFLSIATCKAFPPLKTALTLDFGSNAATTSAGRLKPTAIINGSNPE